MIDIREPDMFAVARRELERLGYTGELMQENYAFRDVMTERRGTAPPLETIPLAAFAQSPPSYRDACFGVALPDDDRPEAIAKYRALGAPVVLALHPNAGIIRPWSMGASGDPEPQDAFPYRNIADAFRARYGEWTPERVRDVRSVSAPAPAAQWDFFDLGLISALESASDSQLTADIEHIMARIETMYKREYGAKNFGDDTAPVFRLLFRLIAAKMLIDRNHKSEWIELDAPAVIAEIDKFYFSRETPEPVLQNLAVQTEAWEQVKQRLFLQNLPVETLAYLYENAFVTEELRRDQSIHATPPQVAEYLLRQLPIEKLPIRERRVFEPFTGHAPFLTAALRRLRGSLPKDISPQERHDYFIAMLSGIENEPFAWEIARYALILADYPNPDGWRISKQDVFTSPDFDTLLQEANIVLSNPPFGKFTAQVRQSVGEYWRQALNDNTYKADYRKDAQALRQVIAKRPAMFGFILPRSFLNRKDFRALRREIAAAYSSVSVTVFPKETFNEAEQEIVCIAAHNQGLPDAPYSYATVSSEEWEDFKRVGKPAFTKKFTALTYYGSDVDFTWTPLHSVWEELSKCATLNTIAELHEGIRYQAGMIEQCVSEEEQPDFELGVHVTRDNLEPYLIREYKYLCVRADVMRDKAYERSWDKPKVLVNRAWASEGYWHIAGAVDEDGLRAERQYYGMWPKSDTPIEALAALISGPVANAYLFPRKGDRDNRIRHINEVPVPPFTAEQTEFIVWAAQEYYAQRGQWLASEGRNAHFEAKCLELLYWIDAAVLEAYDLPAELERELLSAFEGVPRRPLPFHFPGYGVEYERAKETLQKERAHRAVLKQYHALVDKKYSAGLTAAEAGKMEQLGREVDAYYAPFYQPILAALRAQAR